MKHITSRENPLYKQLRLLATSGQARRKAGQTLLDGVHLCESFLDHAGRPALCVVSEPSMQITEVSRLLARCDEARVQCILLPEALYNALSQVENGVGVLFLADVPKATAPTGLTEDAVLLDNLQDPGNLGSILRSAAAAGIRQVLCSRGTAHAWSPKVLRAGMGAHFVIDIVENVNLAELISQTKIPVLATSSHSTERIYDADLRRPVAWLFGHEGQGVSEDLLAMASRTVAIPHLGQIESLNVAASAAICLFEQVRQRQSEAQQPATERSSRHS